MGEVGVEVNEREKGSLPHPPTHPPTHLPRPLSSGGLCQVGYVGGGGGGEEGGWVGEEGGWVGGSFPFLFSD